MYKLIFFLYFVIFVTATAVAQLYSPVAVTGFTQDIFAEAGINSQAVTSTDIDGTNHIMYTTGFATTNGIAGGVINSGNIVSGTRTYQLAPYDANNCLYLSLNGNVVNSTAGNTLMLQSPTGYSRISFLAFSTEGSSTINVSLNFTDGTIVNTGNFLLQDWYVGPSPVYSGFGRTVRLTTAPYTVDGMPTNPRWYAADIPISCANQHKLLQSITINFIGQSGSSGRAVVLAVSGVPYTPITAGTTTTDGICGANNGSIAIFPSGGTSPYTFLWNTIPPQFTSTATGLSPGTYTVTISDADGCTINITKTVDQTSTITANATSNPASICNGDSATLTATSIGGTNNMYTWSPGGQTGSSIRVSPTDTTTYTVTVTDGSGGTGCTATATVSLAVRKKPIASFIASPSRFCLRAIDTVRFTGSAGSTATYNWNFDNASIINGTGVGPYTLQFPTPGNHTIKLIVSENGCSSSETTLTVFADAPSQPAFSVTPTNICSGDTILVNFTGTAFAGSLAAWNWGGGTVISGSGNGPYAVKYITNGTVQLIINNNTCADTAALQTITVTPLPVVAFTYDKLNCAPVTISFTNNSQNGTSYLWDFGDGSTSAAQMPAPHFYNSPGNYNVTLKVTNGNCSVNSAPQLLHLAAFPVAIFTSAPTVTATPVQLSQARFNFTNTSSGATSYKWLFGDGDSSSQASPVHQYKTPGIFTVTLYVSFDNLACFDSISVKPYIIIADSALHITTAFSPNNDGINDRWLIPGLLGYPNCRVEIFDRYGQIVFSSKGYNSPWDGKRNDSDLPIGTYYYLISTSLKNYTGWVFLTR